VYTFAQKDAGMAQLKRTLSTLAVAVALLALLSSMASAEWLYQFGNPQNNNQIPAGTSLNFTNSSDFYITATIDATSVVQASSANNNQVFEYLEGPYIDDSNNKCYALINFKNADTNNGYIPWAHAVLKTDLINYSKEISAKVVANAGEINSSVFNHTNSFYLGGKIDKPILLANTSSPVHEEENCMRVTVLAYQSGEAYFSKILELERNDGIPFKNNQGVNILWPYKYWEVFSSNPDVTPDDSSTYITASPHLQSMAPCFDSAGGVNYMYSYVNSSEVVDTLAGTFHVFPRTFKYSRSFSSNKWQWINAPFINSTSLIELLSFLNTPNYAPSDIDNYNLYKFNEPYLRYDPKYRTMLISGQGKSFLVTAVRQLDDTNVSDRVYISTLPGGIPTSNVT
jgi:hypothetical protein